MHASRLDDESIPPETLTRAVRLPPRVLRGDTRHSAAHPVVVRSSRIVVPRIDTPSTAPASQVNVVTSGTRAELASHAGSLGAGTLGDSPDALTLEDVVTPSGPGAFDPGAFAFSPDDAILTYLRRPREPSDANSTPTTSPPASTPCASRTSSTTTKPPHASPPSTSSPRRRRDVLVADPPRRAASRSHPSPRRRLGPRFRPRRRRDHPRPHPTPHPFDASPGIRRGVLKGQRRRRTPRRCSIPSSPPTAVGFFSSATTSFTSRPARFEPATLPSHRRRLE